MARCEPNPLPQEGHSFLFPPASELPEVTDDDPENLQWLRDHCGPTAAAKTKFFFKQNPAFRDMDAITALYAMDALQDQPDPGCAPSDTRCCSE